MKKSELLAKIEAIEGVLTNTGKRSLSHAKDDDEGSRARMALEALREKIKTEGVDPEATPAAQ